MGIYIFPALRGTKRERQIVMRNIVDEGYRPEETDKAGLVRAAVMFATEDHATTCRKGGIE